MIISRAPVRISFFGGGTDYPEYFLKESGAVLATAIDKYSYVSCTPFLSDLFDYCLSVSYRKRELTASVDEIEHNVYRECLRMCRLDRDIELHNVADLPAFTGLGSSSTFTVSLLHALHSYKGEFLTPLQLAYEAIHVERHLIKEKVGCQDQVMASVGGFHLIEFRKEDDVVLHRAPLPPERIDEFERHMFIVFTGLRRKSSDIAAQQIANIGANRNTLRTMRLMVDQAWDILTGGRSLESFGRLLHQAWLAKRSLSDGISNPDIDRLYMTGMESGAFGGKLLGAGGGGFLLFVAPPERHAHLAKVFAKHYVLRVKINAPGSQIIFS
jgi:D-glycero-alpha-D-manno-heptose-7-phosphate kinase